MALTVDEVLEKIGSLGFYQIRHIAIISYVEWFVITFQVMVPTFLAAEPKWTCVPHVNNTACNFTGEFTAVDNRRCDMPREAWKFTEEFTSVVTRYDLVCDSATLASLSTSLVFGGWLFGSLLGGLLCDIFGRKPVVVVFSLACSLFGLLASFGNSFWIFMVFRLLTGFGIGGAGMGLYVLALEYVGKGHRHVAGTSLWYSWTLALVMLAGLAYGVRDWRMLSIICGVTGLPGFIFLWKFVPESARYLLLKGKVTETENILKNIAKTNKKEYPDEPLANPKAEGKVERMGDVRDLFRTKRMAHRTLVCWYAWVVNGMVYYGVSFSTPTLGGDMYLNFFLSAIIEFPANYAGIWAMGRFGRKKPLVYGMLIAAVASVGAVLFTMYDPGEDKGFLAGRIIMALSAKFFIFISFDAVYVYAAELFPTVIRNIGMGTSTAAARLGSFSSPYIIQSRLVHPLLPYGIMGANALLAALLCQTLPETKGIPTPETLDTDSVEEGRIALKSTDSNENEPEEKDKQGDEDNDITSTKAALVDHQSSI